MTKLKLKIIKLCSDDDSRRQGLMDADPISDDECAFFIFPQRRSHPFWNKNVSFDLSLACVNDRFKVVAFMELKANSEEPVYPESREVKYVVEANRGVFENSDVSEGDCVDFDSDGGVLIFKDDESITSMFDHFARS